MAAQQARSGAQWPRQDENVGCFCLWMQLLGSSFLKTSAGFWGFQAQANTKAISVANGPKMRSSDMNNCRQTRGKSKKDWDKPWAVDAVPFSFLFSHFADTRQEGPGDP